jgi:hypothetical protein
MLASTIKGGQMSNSRCSHVHIAYTTYFSHKMTSFIKLKSESWKKNILLLVFACRQCKAAIIFRLTTLLRKKVISVDVEVFYQAACLSPYILASTIKGGQISNSRCSHVHIAYTTYFSHKMTSFIKLKSESWKKINIAACICL